VLNFPDAPTLNQVFTAAGRSWSWDGTKWIVSGAAPATMIVVNNTTTLTTGFTGFVRVENNTSAPITITLPLTPTASQTITLKDMLGNAGTYPVTVNGNGKTIEGMTTQILAFNFSWLDLIYTGVQWGQT
jgi:hypothetical protein